jgi:hypothetical protein
MGNTHYFGHGVPPVLQVQHDEGTRSNQSRGDLSAQLFHTPLPQAVRRHLTPQLLSTAGPWGPPRRARPYQTKQPPAIYAVCDVSETAYDTQTKTLLQ